MFAVCRPVARATSTSMSTRWLVLLVCVFACARVSIVVVGVCPDPSSQVLANSSFQIPAYNGYCGTLSALFLRQGGSSTSYFAPELQVVANTTVTFSILPSLAQVGYAVPFGLTLSSVNTPLNSTVGMSGDSLGLTVSAESAASGACYAYPQGLSYNQGNPGDENYFTFITNNTFTLNFTHTGNDNPIFATQPCILTWTVPIPDWNNPTPIYYFSPNVGNTVYRPRRIYIVNATVPTDAPTTPTPTAAPNATTAVPTTPVPTNTTAVPTNTSATTAVPTTPVPTNTTAVPTNASATTAAPTTTAPTTTAPTTATPTNRPSNSSSGVNSNTTATPTPTVPNKPNSAATLVPAVLAVFWGLAAFPAHL